VKHPKTAAEVPIRQALIEATLITEIDNKLIKAIIEKTGGNTAAGRVGSCRRRRKNSRATSGAAS
jgi:hypothetical protein